MKRIVLLLITLSIYSCKKDPVNPYNNPDLDPPSENTQGEVLCTILEKSPPILKNK